MMAQLIQQKFKSKYDLHKYITETRKSYLVISIIFNLVQKFLPKLEDTTMKFLQQILRGEKKVLDRARAVDVYFPHYPEFTLEKLFRLLRKMRKFLVIYQILLNKHDQYHETLLSELRVRFDQNTWFI